MLGLRVVIGTVENKALLWLKSQFFLKPDEYESSVLTITNCISEHQQKTFATLSRVFEWIC